MDHEDLIKRLRKDMHNLKPQSEFRKEIYACMGDKAITDKPEKIRDILNSHGYGEVSLDDFNKIFRFRAPDEVIKPLPADPPATKPADDKELYVFSLAEFAAIYTVKSKLPPCRELAVKAVSPDERNEIEFIGDKKKVFTPKLELDPLTQEEWITWSDGPAAFKVEFYSEFDPVAKRIARRFRGWVTKEGEKPIKFDGVDVVPNKDRGPSIWNQYGIQCITGGIMLFALGTYIFKMVQEAAEKKKDAARAQEALEIQKATQAQFSAHIAESRAMAEAAAAESFLESTSASRRGALMEDIDGEFRKAFEDFKQTVDVSRKDGNLEFDFKHQDKDLRETLDTIVKQRISTFVTGNPQMPGGQSLQALVDLGLYKLEDKQARDERITAEATSRLTSSMLNEYGSYKDVLDSNIERMRAEFNFEMLNGGIAKLEGEIPILENSVAKLNKKINDLQQDLIDAKQSYIDWYPHHGDPTIPDYEKKWEAERKKLEESIADHILEHDAKNNERVDAEAKKKDLLDKRDKADHDRKEAEKKKKEREAHFKDHMKLAS
ncbi:hypothetical protein FOQG_16219 [Fusarium oxysporum f. sp. raphani 54005]|uniref:Uncharacterized protein n=2 Tax=Fusarium oxysporum f. sp. raphani TaxID=96318 RepID=X0BKZ7_FUSOX|nr:hypothetical protein FOQG_16219 [Fusarium oxysporum f. sp. raphani 54005]KAG7425583.1 hypothetical protein Forpi1262_v013024 [Fusarium oxysporum f. sp. raphani]